MDDIKSYLILKYGSLHRAFNMWANTYETMPAELHDAINAFFKDYKDADIRLRAAQELQKRTNG